LETLNSARRSAAIILHLQRQIAPNSYNVRNLTAGGKVHRLRGSPSYLIYLTFNRG